MSWEVIFDPAGAGKRLAELEEQMAEPEFWDDGGEAGALRERSTLQARIEAAQRLEADLADAEAMVELGEEGEDEASGMAREALRVLENELSAIEIRHLLGREIPIGAGRMGVEASLDVQPSSLPLSRAGAPARASRSAR